MTDTPTTPSPERQPADAGGGLMPCPFCGSELDVLTQDIDNFIGHVECSGCDMRGPISEWKYEDPEEAKVDAVERWNAAWNRRAPAPQAQPDARAVEGENTAFKIASDLHAAYEQLIYGLPRYLEAENLTDEENMIREAYITLDVTAHRLANLSAPAEDDGWRDMADGDWPDDGSLFQTCIWRGQPWTQQHQQWEAPQTACYRAFHPNAPGKVQLRDKDGKPIHATHWRALPAPPVALHPAAPTDEVGK